MKKIKRDIKGLDLFSYYRDENGNSLLHLAVLSKNINLVRYHSQDINLINAKNFAEETPLHLCANLDYLEGAMTLVLFGANVEVKNGLGWTPLMQSIVAKSKEVFKFLINLKTQYVRKVNTVRRRKEIEYEPIEYKHNIFIEDRYHFTIVHYAYLVNKKLFIKNILKLIEKQGYFITIERDPSWFDPDFLKIFNKESFFEYNYKKDKPVFDKIFSYELGDEEQ